MPMAPEDDEVPPGGTVPQREDRPSFALEAPEKTPERPLDAPQPSERSQSAEPVPSGSSAGSAAAMRFGLPLILITASVIAAAWFFVTDTPPTSPDQVPVVQAPTKDTKTRPEQPGGMEVPNQDKTVYERINPEEKQQTAETLQAPPEKPAPPPTGQLPSEVIENMRKVQESLADIAERSVSTAPPPPPLATQIPDPVLPEAPPPMVQETMTPATMVPQPTKPEPSTMTTAPAPTPLTIDSPRPLVFGSASDTLGAQVAPPQSVPQSTAPQIAEPQQVVKRPEPAQAPPRTQSPPPTSKSVEQAAATPPTKAPAAKAKKPSAATLASSYRIQLVAVRDPASAEKEWQRLQKAHTDVLGSLTGQVIRADLGAKGIFHRLQAGPLANEAAAKTLCAELATRKVNCLVIRP